MRSAARNGPDVGRLSRRSDTVMIDMAWHLDEEYWEPVPQLITNEQIRALNSLLAIPYTNSHDFDYFADE